MTARHAGPSLRSVVMSRKRMPSVGKSWMSRILARSSSASITGGNVTRTPWRAQTKRARKRLETPLSRARREARRAFLEEGVRALARLARRVRLGERVDAVVDGGAQVGVAPADHELLLEPDGGRSAREHPLEQLRGDALQIGGG